MPNVAPSRFRSVLVAAVAALALIGGVLPAHATDPYTPWSSVLPGWNDQLDPGSSNVCASGQSACLQLTLNEMARIQSIEGRSCSHQAIFATAYLRMTQTYGWTRTQPGYYHDVPYMNHMDAVFGKYYTDAYYNYQAGNLAAVPQAWIYAFDAASARSVSGAGDLFLGMNAHINRDLPFVLYASGLVGRDGTSGKGDYDAVERWLYDDTAPLLAEAAQRFDPTIDDSNSMPANYASFQLVSDWRENAWRWAEALANASTPAARTEIAAQIEASADTIAQSLLVAFDYNPLTGSTLPRDAYCALHKNDSAPLAYPMGQAAPWGPVQY